MKKLKFVVLVIGLFVSNLVYAHGVNDGGFMSGFSHPVLGLDHLLAMLSVGILSLQMGGRSIWMVPTTFVLVMLLGGVLGMQDVHLFSVELGIAISVFVLGIAIAIDKKLSPVVAMIFVSFFAIFHGHAHGTEMPYLSKPVFYASGFIVGTACIHIMGVLMGVIAKRFAVGKSLLRYLGAAIAGIGAYLCIGLLV
jgi:urease accessory protein